MLNQLCNLSLIIGLGCISPKAFSNNSPIEIPGLIESLEKLQKLHQDQYKKSKEIISTNVISAEDLQNSKEFKLDPYFLRSILFQSDNKYLSLIQHDECKFYSLLENNLLKSSDEDLLTFNVQLKSKKDVITTGIVSKNIFFEELYKRKCTNNREYTVLFNDTNFLKTILGIKFSVPKGEFDCKSIHGEWLINSYTPYLCTINQTIKLSKSIDREKMTNDQIYLKKLGETYLTKIPLLQRNYIDNLCNNLNNPEEFCTSYLKADIWNKVINGEAPHYKLDFKCSNFLGTAEDLNVNDQKKCAQKFIASPDICYTKGSTGFSSYFPNQNCDTTSQALNHSKLITNYHDCPGNIDNEAITNVHRIINHFVPRKIATSPDTCTGEANYSFARLNLDIKYEKGWPLQICFLNRIDNKENCTQYIPGSRENEPLSEDQVVAKILYLQKGAPPKTKCQIVSSKKYNPVRTDFKNGCFIVYNADACTTLACDKKVYWEEKEQKDIRFIGTPIFEYYPSAFSNERYSVQNLLNEVKSIQSRTIKNLTDLKFYLDKINSSIVHGVGCAEDILPEIYSRISINQCHPIPFIIDGYIMKNGEAYVTTRTSIDDLFSPRLIQWNYIYNGVAAYKELHPLNTWTLNGLKK